MMIRKIESKDSDVVATLVAMMIGDENKEEVAQSVVDDFFKMACYQPFVLENEGTVRGYIVLKTDPFDGGGNLGEIVFLGVDENARQNGYGMQLVKFIEAFAGDLNIRKLYVKTSPTNIKAVCFWINRAYQFEARMRDFSIKNHDDYYMGKALSV